MLIGQKLEFIRLSQCELRSRGRNETHVGRSWGDGGAREHGRSMYLMPFKKTVRITRLSGLMRKRIIVTVGKVRLI